MSRVSVPLADNNDTVKFASTLSLKCAHAQNSTRVPSMIALPCSDTLGVRLLSRCHERGEEEHSGKRACDDHERHIVSRGLVDERRNHSAVATMRE